MRKSEIVMRFRFRIRPLALCATLVLLVLGVTLGQWQTRRAVAKQTLEHNMLSRSAQAPLKAGEIVMGQSPEEFRRIALEGEFLSSWPLYLENRPYQGRPGFYLLMPLRLKGSDQLVWVARGWFARDVTDRTRIPTLSVPSAPVRIEGLVRTHASRVMQLGERSATQPGAILQNFELSELPTLSGLSVHAFIIEQNNDTHDGLVREWPVASAGVEKHRGYAFQWYALALAALLFYLVTGFRSGRKSSS